MIEINSAIAQLQKLKELGATHCWGWDDGSIQTERAPEGEHEARAIGGADESGGWCWTHEEYYSHKQERMSTRSVAKPLT